MEGFETPVLFLIFNRPDLTKVVFKRIREVRPKYLFVAADGPRSAYPEDLEKCKKAREVVLNLIDWECEVKTLFRQENLGCGRAVSQSIDWFFKHVEEGIILEDDTFPAISFFDFCQRMLRHYRNDERIMMISGYNICGIWKSDIQSYHFSYFGGVWCWATWRRAWKHYDFDISVWSNSEVQLLILNRYFPEHKNERSKIYDQLYKKEVDTWDLQWGFSRILNSGMSIIPSKNLALNLGFRKDSTHTQKIPSWYISRIFEIEKIIIQDHVLNDIEYDNQHLSLTHNSLQKSWKQKFLKLM